MKILHYCNNLGSGGAEKLLTDLLPLFKEQNNEVFLALCNTKKNVAAYSKIIEENNIKLINFNCSFYNPFQVFRLVKLVHKHQFNVIHAHLFPSQYWLSFASFFFNKNIRLVKTEHSVHNERKNYKLLQPIERLVYSRYHKIIAITHQVKENLDQWIKTPSKVVVIENGVHLNQVKLAGKQPPPDFLDHNKYNLLMVARFDFFQKDQKTLLLAFSKLNEIQKYHLYFAGEGPNKEHLEKLAKDLNIHKYVTFLGLRSDVYQIMSHVSLNILSTKHEGLSGVTLESLASGVPFLGSNVVGVNNVVPHEKYLFTSENPNELAQKIMHLMENKTLQKELVETALAHVKKYDISFMATKYLSLYSQITTY